MYLSALCNCRNYYRSNITMVPISPRVIGRKSFFLSHVTKSANFSAVNAIMDNDEKSATTPSTLKFHIETYGCQMNISDSEIVRSILSSAGHLNVSSLEDADLVLVNTCAIRENAENKVWNRLKYFNSLRSKSNAARRNRKGYPLVGVLGCMAERLKTRLLEENSVNFICGPDAYRDIPRIIDVATQTDQKTANTQLSLEETYADISPIRETSSSSAFLSIMRGCNNMCSCELMPE